MKNKNAHFKFMYEALKEAQKAYRDEEVPIGAVITFKGKIIARGHNKIIKLEDPTAHAEILAIRKAARYMQNFRLNDAIMYVTIEPCTMCAGALVLARITHLYYGAKDEKSGACGTVFNIANNKKLNHHIKIKGGILEKECRQLVQIFFKNKREKVSS